jgi:hypothetical protein
MNAGTNGGSWRRGNAADLEREGDQLRADMDRTLEDIERELSPDKLLNRSMAFFREHGSDFVREAGDTIRRNPLPVLLTAAGVVWLTAAVASSRSGRSGGSDTPRRRWRGDGGGAHIDEDMASFDDFSGGQGYARSSSERDWSERRERDCQSESGWQQDSQLVRLVREQPLALGALALAAGALLGAALPMTDYENRMMGPSRNRFSSRGRDDGRSQSGASQGSETQSSGMQSQQSREAMTDE